MGPWAGYSGDSKLPSQQSAEQTRVQEERLKAFEDMRKKRYAEIIEETENIDLERELPKPEVTAVFHGSEVHNYQGKSFVQAPGYLKQEKRGAQCCFIPKKWIHSFKGHSKPIQAVRFIKPYGHLALSASHDCKLKLWDVLTNRKCIMTYVGHEMPIRDINFNQNGTKFLSASFDRLIQIWDTETGKVISTVSNRRIPYCALFHPEKDDVVMVGSENRKIIQFDTRTGEIVHQYEDHMGPVNTITFIDNNKRFVTTADDKKVFVWEWGIPVVFKHIMDPDMFPIMKAALHPNGKYFAGQSMSGKIMIYDVKGGFKLNRKKQFTGHILKASPCGICFSPDGQFLCSGDALGKLWFWDWKSMKNYRTLAAHDGLCIDC